MNPSPSELISAYFDGELTGDELAEAERILAGSAAARRLLEDLRSMQGKLRLLPERQLSEGFAEKVLQRAERQSLEPSDAPLVTVKPTRPASPHPGSGRPVVQRIVLAATIAASLGGAFWIVQSMRSPIDTPVVENRPNLHKIDQPDVDRPERGPESSLAAKSSQFPWPVASAEASGTTLDTVEKPNPRAAPASVETPSPSAPKSKGYHWAFVCDSYSQSAQAAVIARFELLLRDQKVALDGNAESAHTETNNKAQAGELPIDRVYVVDATAAQLSAAFKHLEQLAVEQKLTVRVGRGDPIHSSQIAKGPSAGNAGSPQSPSTASGQARAIQLSAGSEKGPALASLPRTPTANASAAAQSIQRAVFVFRVVAPAVDENP